MRAVRRRLLTEMRTRAAVERLAILAASLLISFLVGVATGSVWACTAVEAQTDPVATPTKKLISNDAARIASLSTAARVRISVSSLRRTARIVRAARYGHVLGVLQQATT